MNSRHDVYGLGIVLAAYLAIGTLYAVNTPSWQVPDEPAHYNYVRHIARTGTLPVLVPGDYDQKYIERLAGAGFPPDLPIDSLRYESYAPPLYYLLAAPVFLLFGGALLPLRLFSLALGAGVIVFAFLTVRHLFPARPRLALTAAGFIAFIPQHVAMMAGVNNDSLSELWIAVGLWLILRNNRWGVEDWVLSIVIGFALVTKVHAYVLVPAAGARLLLAWRREGWGEWRGVLRRGVILFAPALVVGLAWWGRNVVVYGWPDFLAAIRHNAVVADQPRTAQWIAAYGAAEVARRFVVTTFQSFWGQFGWMGVVMDRRVYQALLVYSAGLAVGAVEAAVRRPKLTDVERDGVVILSLSGLITLALYLYYNLTFVQHQGRYLFPALIPLGLAAAVGIGRWVKWVAKAARLKAQGTGGWLELSLAFAPIALMAALDLFALYRFILPALS